MELRSERLRLREFEREDALVLHRYNLNPALQRFEDGPPVTEYQFYQIVQDIIADQHEQPRRNFYFVIERLEDAELLGSVYIAVRDSNARQAEIGYMLGAEFWGQGYATEAARTVLDYGFETLALHRVYAEALSENHASVRVLEKLGMRREALLRHHRWFQERWWDTCIYALLEDEWRT